MRQVALRVPRAFPILLTDRVKMKRTISATAVVLFVLALNSCTRPKEIDASKLQEQDGLFYEEGESEPFTGKAVRYYTNGQKEEEKSFKDGKKDGLFVGWYENGQKKNEGNFKDAKKNGLWVSWYKNGQKMFETHYKDDKNDGLEVFWLENGQKMSAVNYKDGKRDGS